MNLFAAVGRLTADPELRHTSSSKAVAQFTIAVDRQFKQDGQPTADFLPVVAWGKTGELAAQYLRKGSQCAISGRISTRNYDNAQGQKVYVTEVVADQVRFLDPKQSGGQPSGGNQSGNRNDDPFKDDGKPMEISDDLLPF